MSRDALLDSLSKHRMTASSALQSPRVRQFDLVMFSAKSLSRNGQEIYAMRNSYVDFVATDGKMKAGDAVFRLNTLELDRETFKLAVELENARLTEKRLSKAYVDRIVLKPMLAGVDFASADLQAAKDELQIAQDRFQVGEMDAADVAICQTQVAERTPLLARAEADLTQRYIELMARRRLGAELLISTDELL